MAKNPKDMILCRPIACDACKSGNIHLADNRVLYGRSYGDWPLIWHCKDCDAAVGCHPGKVNPLGKMADSKTRKARARTHEAFDPIWKRRNDMTRSKAYSWLAHQLGIPEQECHISWFDFDTCQQVIKICKNFK